MAKENKTSVRADFDGGSVIFKMGEKTYTICIVSALPESVRERAVVYGVMKVIQDAFNTAKNAAIKNGMDDAAAEAVAIDAAKNQAATFAAGDWAQGRSGDGGHWRTAIEAVAANAGKENPAEYAAAVVSDESALKKAKAHPKVKAEYARMAAERAAKKAAAADANADADGDFDFLAD